MTTAYARIQLYKVIAKYAEEVIYFGKPVLLCSLFNDLFFKHGFRYTSSPAQH